MNLSSKNALSIVEVLAGIVIVSVIGTASWFSITTTMRAGEMARNRNMANNLLQHSQEELRRVARTNFNLLGTSGCLFPPLTNTCGFEDIDLDKFYPGFISRTLEVQLEAGEAGFKKAIISVQWNEMGKVKTLHSIVLLSRPPDELPGNISGKVTSDADSDDDLPNVNIKVKRSGASEEADTISGGLEDDVNYNFLDPISNRFILTPGDWQLTATRNGFKPYTHSILKSVKSGETTDIDFAMIPNPASARIRGRILESGTPISFFHNGEIHITMNGSLAAVVNSNNNSISAIVRGRTSYDFFIPFEDEDPKCFTIATKDAFKEGYGYPVNAAGGLSCPFNYRSDGWSSAVVDENGNLTCENPAFGGPGADRICVNPGDDIMEDISLSDVREVKIKGDVVDSNGNAVSGATIFARWPRDYDDSARAWWRTDGATRKATADDGGVFTGFGVPAVQDLFPNGSSNDAKLLVFAKGSIEIGGCCNKRIKVDKQSAPKYIGPPSAGDPEFDVGTFVINVPADLGCGDAEGVITGDPLAGFKSGAVPGARVRVGGRDDDDYIDSTGDYKYFCPDSGFRIPATTYAFRVEQSDFYPYHSSGTNYYAPNPNGHIRIKVDQTTIPPYNVKLWPKGKGNITGKVFTGDPDFPIGIAGANVELILSDGRHLPIIQTDASGDYNFNDVDETWPPSIVVSSGDNYYNKTPQIHTIKVTDLTGIYEAAAASVANLDRGQTVTVNIELHAQGYF